MSFTASRNSLLVPKRTVLKIRFKNLITVSSLVSLEQPFYAIHYIGSRLNPKHLRHSECWDIKVEQKSFIYIYMSCIVCCLSFQQYLGCVTGISDWQTPSTRAEFMQIIDDGQVMNLTPC